jgi:hypothetical protein
MICARPKASLASVLLTFSDSAALAWRASTQITGSPACFNSWNSQLDSCPLSSPIRTAHRGQHTACSGTWSRSFGIAGRPACTGSRYPAITPCPGLRMQRRAERKGRQGWPSR